MDELDRRIAEHTVALRRLSRRDSGRAAAHARLAVALNSRYDRARRSSDLNAAVEHYLVAVADRGVPSRLGLLDALVSLLWDRFDAQADVADLHQAERVARDALADTPATDPGRVARMGYLGWTVYRRYGVTRDPADLTAAVTAFRRTFDTTNPGSSELPERAALLGQALYQRYHGGGQAMDLDEAIYHLCLAVDSTELGPQARPNQLRRLALAYWDRFSMSGDVADLDAAIQRQTEAVDLVPDDIGAKGFLGLLLAGYCRRTGDTQDAGRAAKLLRDAAAESDSSHAKRGQWLDYAGTLLLMKARADGAVADLDGAIECGIAAVDATTQNHPKRPTRLNHLAEAFRGRHRARGNRADLSAAIDAWRAAIAGTVPRESAPGPWLGELAIALHERYELTGDMADLSAAIDYYQQALAVDTASPTERAGWLTNLGAALHTRFGFTGEMTDLAGAIERHQTALGVAGLENDVAAGTWTNLAIALTDRARNGGGIADFDAAVEQFAAALHITPQDDSTWAEHAGNLANAYQVRFGHAGRAADLEAGLEMARRSWIATASDDPFVVERADGLATLLRMRFEHVGDANNLDEAVALLTPLVGQGTDTDPQLISARLELAGVLYLRSAMRPDGSDLATAIGIYEAVLEATPDDAPDRPHRLNVLATARHVRYERLGDPADLHAAVPLHEQAVASTSMMDSRRGTHLSDLGAALRDRFLCDGYPLDLDRAVDCFTQALAAAVDEPERAGWLNNLAAALLSRFQHYGPEHQGKDSDLDQAIAHLTAAVSGTDRADPAYAQRLRNLADALDLRGEYRGAGEDLDTAIRLRDQAASSREDRTPDFKADIDEGYAALVRYDRYGELVDLDRAIDRLRTAVDAAPTTGHALANRVALLAGALDRRFQASDDLADLDEAATLLDRALAVVDEGDARRPDLIRNRALAAFRRYEHTDQIDDLNEAVRLFRLARAATTQDSPDWPDRHVNLGSVLRLRFLATGSTHDLDAAISALAVAVSAVESSFWHPLMGWAHLELARAYRDRGDTQPARQHGIVGLRARLCDVLLATDTEDRLAAAREAGDRALRVARWCLIDGDLHGAIHTLEHGRALTLHTATVSATMPELLRHAGASDLALEWEASNTTRHTADRHQRSATLPAGLRYRALQALLSQKNPQTEHIMRQLLSPPTLDEIRQALARTDTHALVYLLPGDLTEDQHGHAVVITNNDPPVSHLSLPDLTRLPNIWGPDTTDPLNRYLNAFSSAFGQPCAHQPDDAHPHCAECLQAWKAWHHSLHDLCDWAWDAAMAAILTHLRDSPGPATTIPHIVLVPLGELGLVPWHAARTYTDDRADTAPCYAVEQAVISYATSARQYVDTAHRPELPRDGRALLVGNPTGDLPNAAREVTWLRDTCYPDGWLLGSPGEDNSTPARPDDLLAAMPSAAGPGLPVLHLACHGTAGHSAASSHLVLADQEALTVERLLVHTAGREPGTPGPLIVLSACETNVTADVFDEVMTLTTGFLTAGAASAIGSLWQVDDAPTALLMQIFHERFQSGLGPAEALRAAQCWMLDADREQPNGIVSHLNDIDLDRLWSNLDDPYWWAPFTHQGR